MSDQANEMASTKDELRKANERAKQVESVALKAREESIEGCNSCLTKVNTIAQLNQLLKDKDEQITRMKLTHEKHAAEMNENQNQYKCDCRYKVMEARAEVETHVAAGEKLKNDREKYKLMYHQYAKERQSAMDRLQDCEEKLSEKDERIRRLKQENNNNSNGYKTGKCNSPNRGAAGRGAAAGECRIIGAMKDTMAELTDEIRAKDCDIRQLQSLVAKLDLQLRDTEEQTQLSKSENAQLATELMKRIQEYEGSLNERETLIQENARLKLDMVAMVPKMDAKSPRKASAIAELDRLTEKLQDTEKQLIDCRKEIKKLKEENKKQSDKLLRRETVANRDNKNTNENNSNDDANKSNNKHVGNHRNCLTCRLLNKLQMGLSNCKKCKDDSKHCRCQKNGKLPASIRREIEDFEVPWPTKTSD